MAELEEQKQQCPFCKIIAGDIPSTKVYEDDACIGILDIHPAAKGHILLMPKEHYYVLPLVPPDVNEKLFRASRTLMHAMRKGLIVPRVTLFVANGPAAGQQSPHFLLHLIPREDGDGLDQLDLNRRETPQRESAAIAQNMQAIMRKLNPDAPIEPSTAGREDPSHEQSPASPPSEPPKPQREEYREDRREERKEARTSQERLDKLFQLLKEEPGLHKLLIENPAQVEESVKQNPALQQVFEGIDIHALSERLKTQEQEEDVPRAKDLSDEELAEYVRQKPRLAELLRTDPKRLEEMIPDNERLATFFEGTTPQAVADRLDGGVDFDLLAKHL